MTIIFPTHQAKRINDARIALLREELQGRLTDATRTLFEQSWAKVLDAAENERLVAKAGAVAIFATLYAPEVLKRETTREVFEYLRVVRFEFGTYLTEGARQGLDLAIGYVEGYLR